MIQDLKKYLNLKNSLFQFFLFLSFFGLCSTADLFISTINPLERNQYIVKFLAMFITSGVVYYLIRYGFGLTRANPLNFLISTWIVYLLIHPTNSIWYCIIAIIAIAIGKYLFKRNTLPIFNPAALGLTLTYAVSVVVTLVNPSVHSTLLVSWWGADMTQNITNTIPVVSVIVPVVFLLGFMYFSYSFKKLTYSCFFFATFLITRFAYTYMTASLESALSLAGATVFNATVFRALVMLAEPKTSPLFPKYHITIGILVGLALFVFYTFLGTWLIDPLLTVVLFANIITLLTKIKWFPTKTAQVTS